MTVDFEAAIDRRMTSLSARTETLDWWQLRLAGL